jgi:polysaccharide chain length determinant protein (PEP-CTERM system associated)
MNTGAGGLQLGDLSGVVRRRAGIAGAVAGAVFLSSILVAAILPNRYQAWVTLLVEPQTISSKLIEAGIAESDLNSRLHLMTMQILSRGRLSKVIDDLGLYPEESKEMTREEVISLMRAHIRVEPVLPELETGTTRRQDIEINTFRLYYRSDKPKVAADVANRLANDFIDEHIKERVQVAGDTAEFISAELERLSGQLREVETRIANVKNQNPGKLPEDLTSNQRQLERVLESLRDAREDKALAESDRAFYQQQTIVAANAMPRVQEELSPERKLDLVKLNLAAFRARGFTDKHPDVIATLEEMNELERQAEERAAEEAGGVKEENFAQMNARAEAERAELRSRAAESDVERLTAQVNDIQERLATTPRVAEQLAALEREYTHLFQSYQEYSAKGLEAGVAANMERRQKGEQFRILEAAFTPPEPSSPNRLVIALVGVMLGLALGGGVALLLESVDTSFHAVRQLQGALQVPVLASVPKLLLASDRARIQRRRVMTAVLAAGISGVVLIGAGIGYVTVNGAPGFVRTLLQGDEGPAAGPAEGQRG